MNIQNMSDREYLIYQSRQFGARMYRAEGYEWFADRVEKGLEDQCNPVRLGMFFHNLPEAGVGMAAE